VSVDGVLPSSTVVVAVDVGERSFAVSVTAADRRRLLGPVEVAMTGPAVSELVGRICAVVPAGGCVQVAVEAAGHYHQTTSRCWPRRRGRLAGRFGS
jgi:transposase